MLHHKDASLIESRIPRNSQPIVGVARVCFIALACLCSGLSFLHLGCKDTPPEPTKPATISLKAEDASCTEAWLKVSSTELPATIRLVQVAPTTRTKQTLRLISRDSLLIDEGLLPNRTYTYQLQKLAQDSSVIERSASVAVTTMDTTSHNFTWQIDTLGVTSSVLYDVAIINDTLAYAVGEIFLRDSTGQIDPIFYNLAKWNGRQWSMTRVYYQGTSLLHPTWILAFSERDMWITPVTHWDGSRFHDVAFDPVFSGVRTNKAWGTSSSNFYVVGDGGFIAHYNGATWQRVESGTNSNVNDVWGNTALTPSMILAGASNRHSTGERKLLHIAPAGSVEALSWLQQQRLHTVWFVLPHKIFVGGGGLFVGTPSSRWQEVLDLPLYFSTRVRGTTLNNIWVVGAFGLCGHFNGVSWKSFPEVSLQDGTLEGLSVTGTQVIAAGQVGNKAVVVRGRAQ